MTALEQRKEIARYLLARGSIARRPCADDAGRSTSAARSGPPIVFPDGVAPQPHLIDPAPIADDPLPQADVVVITWTVDEVAGLAHVS